MCRTSSHLRPFVVIVCPNDISCCCCCFFCYYCCTDSAAIDSSSVFLCSVRTLESVRRGRTSSPRMQCGVSRYELQRLYTSLWPRPLFRFHPLSVPVEHVSTTVRLFDERRCVHSSAVLANTAAEGSLGSTTHSKKRNEKRSVRGAKKNEKSCALDWP